jgi:hypothetical protein
MFFAAQHPRKAAEIGLAGRVRASGFAEQDGD